MREIVIKKNDAAQRIDKFLTKYMCGIPRAMLYKGLRKNYVKVNGRHVRDGGYMLCEGDVVRLYFKEEFFSDKRTELSFMTIKPCLEIVYEDENIILIDKKPGVNVHTDNEGDTNTLIGHLKAYLYQKGEYDPKEEQSFSPALCNRIDRNTGGIVIAAKNAEALRIMNDKIKNREMKKMYLLIASGIFDKKKGRFKNYLLKDEQKKTVFVYDSPREGAKTAITDYRVIAQKEGNSLVEAELLTGRTHQIRAQFAHAGHPLLGDGKYGSNKINRGTGFYHQALYSYKLKFTFETESGILSYLDGKEFSVKKVPFAEDFIG